MNLWVTWTERQRDNVTHRLYVLVSYTPVDLVEVNISLAFLYWVGIALHP